MNAQAYTNTVNAGPVEIIFRRDAANNRVGFFKQTADLSSDKIEMWTEGGGKETREVPLSYYHATTKLEHPDMLEIQNRFAEQFTPTFGIAVKHRLFKNSKDHHTYPGEGKSANDTQMTGSKRRSTDTKEFDQSEYLAKMSVAITAAVKAALEAVNAEYSK